ncbi:MAG: c-type cytochrome [Planctomycetales bacterium]
MVVTDRRWMLGVVLAAVGLSGCGTAEVPQFVAAQAGKDVTPELKKTAEAELVKYTGSFLAPKYLAEPEEATPNLVRGQAVYQERCVQCHGVSGDGEGPEGHFMYPRPRDYRKGIFKFTSTPYGSKPLREDLLRTIRKGVRGTSMPSFSLLPNADQQAVADYVMMLTRRGELEQQLLITADTEQAIDPELVKTDLIPAVLNRWRESESQEVSPVTPQPRFTTEHVARGKKAFLEKGCSKCHGEDGRGQAQDDKWTDAWGFATRAADLTSGMLHGGDRPIDIYRRIQSGINGTPMPSFASVFQKEPDTVWDLVAFVLSTSNGRRSGEVPPPSPIRPYVPVAAAPAAAK